MKIKLISDTHFEFYEDQCLFNNDEQADVLVVAGDLAVGYRPVWSALKRFADLFKHVVYVSGNHEYYRQSMPEFDSYISRFSSGTNIHYLNPGKVTLEGIDFIGGTLWTNFRDDHFAKLAAKGMISDFRVIPGFSTTKCEQLFYEHLETIQLCYSLSKNKKVIITHFLPTIECTAPRFINNGIVNYYFANDLGHWAGNLKDTTWMFGHTHDCVDIKLGDTRLIANPYGYNRNENYLQRIIEV
jgi:DNA repair exonuclease SbcCD nuclease subunit